MSKLSAPTLGSLNNSPMPAWSPEDLCEAFPILQRPVRGRRLVYLDNAATTQKPRVVIESLVRYYQELNANVHRGIHYLSERATEAFEQTRRAVQRFIGSRSVREIIFTRGTTESINLVAWSFGRQFLKSGDEIVITHLEHHSNIVPWQMLCQERGTILRVVPLTPDGELDWTAFERMVNEKTKLISVAHVSNVLGTVNPVREIVRVGHAVGAKVFIDGAQAAPHLAVDVQELDCDFYVFSAHKMYGPTGVGILYGKEELLEAMPPYQGGGDMIASVTFERTTYNVLPYKFEAGTPNIADVVAFKAALDFLDQLGMEQVTAYEDQLLHYALQALGEVPGLIIYGRPQHRCGAIAFNLDGIHPHDLGTVLDQEGIAIRTGHHCAQPLMDWLGVAATARASLAVYNSTQDIDELIAGLYRARRFFRL
ncbi:MAG: cysteine desulfurase [Gemmatales bacterium]|nr:cysteine desulfurase [Gemmatales bacterium]